MTNQAITYTEQQWVSILEDLKTLIRIPSISADGFDPAPVTACAQAIVHMMKQAGLTEAEVIKIEGVHAYAYGSYLGAGPNAPTLLLYGHHDVQPVGREHLWVSPPFDPTIRQGRLYGRGSVDDKAGVMVHLAAIAAYLKSGNKCPVNFKFIVEGEEEIGSNHLHLFLERYRDKIQADYIVLTDTSNFDTGIPALTYQLRGIVATDITVSTLRQPVHSGMWGGPTPDPVLALCQILARLQNKDGQIAIPGLYDDVDEPPNQVKTRLQALPFNEAQFKQQAGFLEGVQLAGESKYSVYEKLWMRPALSINAIEASSMKNVSNQIVDVARARVGIRIVPSQDEERITQLLESFLKQNPPYGVHVDTKPARGTPWWKTNPQGPAFDAALRAMEKGYGVSPVLVGCGGSIGFVQPFSDILGGVPALLIGLEDPQCNAHSENESLDLGDFKKAIHSAIFLYEELSKI